jgi:hypothetical protein
VTSIVQDREGLLWFSTFGSGVSRYDGQTFTTFTTQDGLAHNSVTAIAQDGEGALWFTTKAGGVTRYRQPAPAPPPVFIDAVLADRRYEDVYDIAIQSSVELTIFEFHGTSFKTRPEAMVYRYRLQGYQENWKTTRTRRVEYQSLPRGHYTFQVEAVDRDQVYSAAPATVTLTVHLPYERIGWLSALSIAIVLVAWQTTRVIRRDRHLSRQNQQLTIERAAERIRAEAMDMESTDDLHSVVGLILQELQGLGVPTLGTAIGFIDTESDQTRRYHARDDLDALGIPYDPDKIRKLPSGKFVFSDTLPLSSLPAETWTETHYEVYTDSEIDEFTRESTEITQGIILDRGALKKLG